MARAEQGRHENSDGRDESLNERMDRNWNEILQELRVTQTGTQILSGFLLAVAFQPKFEELDRFQLTVYLILVIIAGLTTALALAPVGLHRALFRKQAKERIVTIGHVLLMMALIGVGLVLTGTALLIFDFVLDRTAGLMAGGFMFLIACAIAIVPSFLRLKGTGEERA